jgi:hypothetical protein
LLNKKVPRTIRQDRYEALEVSPKAYTKIGELDLFEKYVFGAYIGKPIFSSSF